MRTKDEIKSLGKSFKNALGGICLAVKSERNFRIHMCMVGYVLIFSALGEVGAAAVSRFLICFGLVSAAELFNTALELLCSSVSDRFDFQIRAIKDISAGAVLLTALFSAAVGLITFLSRDVFFKIITRLWHMPYVTAAIIISIPFAVLFVVGRGKR